MQGTRSAACGKLMENSRRINRQRVVNVSSGSACQENAELRVKEDREWERGRLERAGCRELGACSSVWCHLLAELDQAVWVKLKLSVIRSRWSGADWCDWSSQAASGYNCSCDWHHIKQSRGAEATHPLNESLAIDFRLIFSLFFFWLV